MERLTTGSILCEGYTLKSMCIFNSNSSVQDEEKLCPEQCVAYEGWDCTSCSIKKAFDRLAAYEDTGLTPEEVEALKADNARLRKLLDEKMLT